VDLVGLAACVLAGVARGEGRADGGGVLAREIGSGRRLPWGAGVPPGGAVVGGRDLLGVGVPGSLAKSSARVACMPVLGGAATYVGGSLWRSSSPVAAMAAVAVTTAVAAPAMTAAR